MERPFPAIGRIADLCWEPKQIVFEIQCSPISQEEAEHRNRDYRSQGYEVVWILHDKRFNRKRLSAAEWHLRTSTCYFTNLSPQGEGIIYDQFDICHQAVRSIKGPRLPVYLDQPQILNHGQYPSVFKEKFAHWKLNFTGDLLDRLAKDPKQMEQLQKRIEARPKPRLEVLKTIKYSYLRLLETLLKKLSANIK